MSKSTDRSIVTQQEEAKNDIVKAKKLAADIVANHSKRQQIVDIIETSNAASRDRVLDNFLCYPYYPFASELRWGAFEGLAAASFPEEGQKKQSMKIVHCYPAVLYAIALVASKMGYITVLTTMDGENFVPYCIESEAMELCHHTRVPDKYNPLPMQAGYWTEEPRIFLPGVGRITFWNISEEADYRQYTDSLRHYSPLADINLCC